MIDKIKVFISYSHEDKEITDDLISRLRNENFLCIRDDELRSGESISEQLRRLISECVACIFIATNKSAESQWCLEELGAFWGAGKKIIIYQPTISNEKVKIPELFQQYLRADTIDSVISSLKEEERHILNKKKKEIYKKYRIILTFIIIVFVISSISIIYNTQLLYENLYKIRLKDRDADEPIEGNIFQDFKEHSDINDNNPVYYLWSDVTANNSIQANVLSEDKEQIEQRFLRITFFNRGGFPSNIAISPLGKIPIKKPYQYNKLILDARLAVADKHLVENCDNQLSTVSLAFRVVDRKMTHWEYADKTKEYVQKKIKFTNWSTIELNLAKLNSWNIFDADGNIRYAREHPDFSVIYSIVIELGSDASGRPGNGCGVVDIRNLRFSNQ